MKLHLLSREKVTLFFRYISVLNYFRSAKSVIAPLQ